MFRLKGLIIHVCDVTHRTLEAGVFDGFSDACLRIITCIGVRVSASVTVT